MEEALTPTGVTGPKFNVLMELAASPDGALPLSEVARRLLRSPPNITTLIDRMEADGFVRRRRPAGDRRVVTAEITEGGWKALGRAAPVVFEGERRLLSCLSRGQRRDLARLLDSVSAEVRQAQSNR
jgi:DNA-binding MarR family transcriptional regulator